MDLQMIQTLEEQGINYLTKYRTDKVNLTKFDSYMLAINEMFHREHIEKNRTLYHLTLTYKSPRNSPNVSESTYTIERINKKFILFYTRFLLVELLGRNHTNINKKQIQPISFVFIENHKMNNTKQELRFHHHAILAVHQETVERFNKFLGTNTFKDLNKSFRFEDAESSEQKRIMFTDSIMSSDLKIVDTKEFTQVLYAQKQYKQYSEHFLCFPDSMKRHKVKYRLTKHIKPKRVVPQSFVTTYNQEHSKDINTIESHSL
jgi:hypothetical protein